MVRRFYCVTLTTRGRTRQGETTDKQGTYYFTGSLYDRDWVPTDSDCKQRRVIVITDPPFCEQIFDIDGIIMNETSSSIFQ